jgi:hypothetical protein
MVYRIYKYNPALNELSIFIGIANKQKLTVVFQNMAIVYILVVGDILELAMPK